MTAVNTGGCMPVWPPASCCARCGGNGGWYRQVGAVDWDWTTCQACGGTSDKPSTHSARSTDG